MDLRFPWMGCLLLVSIVTQNSLAETRTPRNSVKADPELVEALGQPLRMRQRRDVRRIASSDNSASESYPSNVINGNSRMLRPQTAPASSYRRESALATGRGFDSQTDSSRGNAVSTSTSSYEGSHNYRTREKHFSLVIPSVVVHGFAIEKDVADQMPRKLDGGQTVMTPGAGLEYVSPGGVLVLGGLLKDCYNNLAGLFQIGQRFRIGEHTSIGYSLGIYARETPTICSTSVGRFGRKTTKCDEFDNYQLKWITAINNESVDVIPMPFLHFTTALISTDDFELDFKVMTNFALNEFGFSVPF